MSNLHKDLDIFLFSLDHRYYPVTCLDKSVNGNTSNEAISITLPSGTYAIIIDGWRSDQKSSFTLSMHCSGTPLPNCENFDHYYRGSITAQSSNWIKYNSHSYYDAQVTGYRYYSQGNSLRVKRVANNEPDVVRRFGEKTHGKYKVSWKMYVPRDKNATFNIKKYNDPKRETGVAVYLRMGRGMAFRAKNNLYHSNQTYSQDRWLDVEMYIDLDRETTILYIDHAPVAKWKTRTIARQSHPGKNRFAGINFWAYSSYTDFFVDDVCFEQNPHNMPNYHYTPAMEL